MNNFGAIPSPKDIRDYRLKTNLISIENLPKEFLIKSIPIKNQGDKPTCVAHSLSEIIEFQNMRDTQVFTKFSTDFI